MNYLNRMVRRFWPTAMFLGDFAAILILGGFIFWETNIYLIITKPEYKNTLIIGLAGLALSIITLYITIIRPIFQKARLAYKIDPQPSESPKKDSPGSMFYRIKIENYGLTRATHCIGRLIGVWDCNGNQITKFDPLTLYWTRQDGKENTPFQPIDIQGHGDFDFLDIVQQIGNKLVIRVFIPSPMTLTNMPENFVSPGNQPDLILPGLYYLKVVIYSGETFISPMILKIGSPEESGSPTKKLIFEKVRKIPNSKRK